MMWRARSSTKKKKGKRGRKETEGRTDATLRLPKAQTSFSAVGMTIKKGKKEDKRHSRHGLQAAATIRKRKGGEKKGRKASRGGGRIWRPAARPVIGYPSLIVHGKRKKGKKERGEKGREEGTGGRPSGVAGFILSIRLIFVEKKGKKREERRARSHSQ